MSNLSSLLDRYKALVIFDTETSGLEEADTYITRHEIDDLVTVVRTVKEAPA